MFCDLKAEKKSLLINADNEPWQLNASRQWV